MKIDDELKQDFILLGKQIRKLRQERNLTIQEISKITGISIQYLTKIETGLAYGVLMGRHLLKISNAFQVKFSDLFKYN